MVSLADDGVGRVSVFCGPPAIDMAVFRLFRMLLFDLAPPHHALVYPALCIYGHTYDGRSTAPGRAPVRHPSDHRCLPPSLHPYSLPPEMLPLPPPAWWHLDRRQSGVRLSRPFRRPATSRYASCGSRLHTADRRTSSRSAQHSSFAWFSSFATLQHYIVVFRNSGDARWKTHLMPQCADVMRSVTGLAWTAYNVNG